MSRLKVEVVSDVVCPWCLIGIRRLEQAFEMFPELEPELSFKPFLLDPNTPAEGADLRERLERKYGLPAEGMFARVEDAARQSGIALDFAKVRRSVNTLAAHTLLRHAPEHGSQVALKKALLSAYFLEGRDVSEREVLVDIATQHRFTRDEVLELLDSPSEREDTRREAMAAVDQGVTGVPFVRIGTHFGVPGAQSPEVFASVIKRELSRAAD